MVDRRLFYVVSTASYGSFTAAGHRVGVAQSTITKSVSDLEQQIGFTIFNRTARGAILTEEGRVFVDRASRLLDEAQALMQSAPTRTDPYAGVLKIGVTPPPLDSLLVEPVALLMSRHPTIQLEITGGNYDRIVQELRTGAIDIAVGVDTAWLPHPEFRMDCIAPFHASYFVRQGHPILEHDEVTREEIGKYDLIWPSGALPYISMSPNAYSRSGANARDRLHIIERFPIVERLVRDTNAIGLITSRDMDTAHFRKYFARVPFTGNFTPPMLCCATRKSWVPRPAARAFIQACREKM